MNATNYFDTNTKSESLRRRPQVDDIHYNQNTIRKLQSQGVDVSKFIVAKENTRRRKLLEAVNTVSCTARYSRLFDEHYES